MNAMKRRYVSMIIGIVSISFLFYAYQSGITGRTQLNGEGCTCHGSASPAVTVTIVGPDTLLAGQSAAYTVTISGGPLVRAGTNIAASAGVLTTLNAALQEMGGELTHTQPLAPEGSTVTFTFQFQAPAEAGPVTLYANGNSVNFDGSNSDDEWNYAPNKIVQVMKMQTLTVKSFIQGFFDGSSTVQDTLKAELHEAGSPFTIVASAVSFFTLSGLSVFTFSGAENATPYYLALKHRNAVETWTAQTLQFVNDTASYDFTDAASKAFGDNLIPVAGNFCIYAGDVTQDGIVDFSDLALVDNDQLVFSTGYLSTDVNGDGIVDFSDLSILDNNSLNFITSAHPGSKRPAKTRRL